MELCLVTDKKKCFVDKATVDTQRRLSLQEKWEWSEQRGIKQIFKFEVILIVHRL